MKKTTKVTTKKIDIKDLNIPNICFSLTTKDDTREKKFKEQRIERGFDDSETWSLSDSIINFSLPRLKRYKEIVEKVYASKKHIKQVDKVIIAFELLYRDHGSRLFTEEEEKKVIKGLSIYHKIFLELWW